MGHSLSRIFVFLGMFAGILWAEEEPKPKPVLDLKKFLEESTPPWEKETVELPPILKNALKHWEEVVQAAISVVKTIPTDAPFMTHNQRRAIEILAKYHPGPEGQDELIRVVTVRGIPPGAGMWGGSRDFTPRRIDRYPAARALAGMGPFAVDRIFQHLMTDPTEPDAKRMWLYAEIILLAWGKSDIGLEYLRKTAKTYTKEPYSQAPYAARFIRLAEEAEKAFQKK